MSFPTLTQDGIDWTMFGINNVITVINDVDHTELPHEHVKQSGHILVVDDNQAGMTINPKPELCTAGTADTCDKKM